MNFQESIEWRRNKVYEYLVKGYSQFEIARILKISQPTISRDIQFIREQNKQEMKNYRDKLNDEYQKCLKGIDQILKLAWESIDSINSKQHDENTNSDNNSSSILLTKHDNKIKLDLGTLSVIKDCYEFKMKLLSNPSIQNHIKEFVDSHLTNDSNNKKIIQNINDNLGYANLERKIQEKIKSLSPEEINKKIGIEITDEDLEPFFLNPNHVNNKKINTN